MLVSTAVPVIVALLALSGPSRGTSVELSITVPRDSNTEVYADQLIEMYCAVVQLPAATIVTSYHWTMMELPLADVKGVTIVNNSLRIPFLSYMHHLGDYQCEITLSTGKKYNSNTITLTPKFAAIFPANGSTVYVQVNQTAIIGCVVFVPVGESAESTQIRWAKMGRNGKLTSLSQFSMGNTLIMLENVSEQEAGDYRCILVTNNSGQSYAEIELIVVSKPKFSDSSSGNASTTIEVGSRHTIGCGPVDSRAALNFTWYQNGAPLQFNERITVNVETKSSVVHIANATYAEAGTFLCIVSNSAGFVQRLTNITVRGPPQILNQHIVITVPITAESVSVDCPHVSNPHGEVVWEEAGQELSVDGSKYRISTNGSLLLHNLVLNDSGNYTCRVYNQLGDDRMIYTLLIIDFPRQPQNLNISFEAESSRTAVVTWTAHTHELNQPVTRYQLLLQFKERTVDQTYLLINSTSTRLSELWPGEEYKAILRAINDVGISQSTIHFIQPISAPSLLFDVSPQVDGYSLFMRWQLQYDGGPSVNKFSIKVYKVENGSQSLIDFIEPDLALENYMLADLEPITAYVLEVCISNGVKENNMDFNVTTLTAAPSKPSPPTVILKTTHILKIMFTVEEGSYPMTSLLLNTTQLLSNGGSSTTQEQIEISNVLHVDSVEVLTRKQYKIVLTVRGLEQLTFYTFKVAAISAAGEGEFSEPSTPTTLEDGRILYYIVFSVVGGAILILIITIAVAMVVLCTSRRIQQTKRTLSINGTGSQRGIADSFLGHSSNERRCSNHSLQISSLNGLDCTSGVATPSSSFSDYKHHMLRSSTSGNTPLYDKLSNYQKGSISSDEKRPESVFSDGPPSRITVDMFASDGRIDSVMVNNMRDNGASAQERKLFSSAEKVHSANCLHQMLVLDRQHLPSSLPKMTQQQHLLCPPRSFAMAGSSPAINYRRSCESILDKPTNYMTDV